VPERRWRIAQVSTFDLGGGADRCAWLLHQAYRRRGLDAWLVVGTKRSADPYVVPLRDEDPRGSVSRALRWGAARVAPLAGPHADRAQRALRLLAHPRRAAALLRGHECFDFPASSRLLEMLPEPPDVVHCHNLHNNYFDLGALEPLSRQVPVVLTVHDSWLATGHCAHPLRCERWLTGCGECPDLGLYPRLLRDGTRHNWREKARIFERARVAVASPSGWLLDRVQRSLVGPAITRSRVIPNGIDLAVFRPAERAAARRELGLEEQAIVLLFVAQDLRRNPWKDYATVRDAALRIAAARRGERVILVGLGDASPPERIGPLELRFVPFQPDPALLARHYQSADLYLYAAHAEAFGYTVVEALACGLPVVATSVGGLTELVEDGRTGHLVGHGDAPAMAQHALALLADASRRRAVATAAVAAARARFDLADQVQAYLDFYEEARQATRDRLTPSPRAATD
jgi:glycosyltransferase involved in cell wall biosynthesis